MWEQCGFGLGLCVCLCSHVPWYTPIITAFPLLSSLSEVRAAACMVIMTLWGGNYAEMRSTVKRPPQRHVSLPGWAGNGWNGENERNNVWWGTGGEQILQNKCILTLKRTFFTFWLKQDFMLNFNLSLEIMSVQIFSSLFGVSCTTRGRKEQIWELQAWHLPIESQRDVTMSQIIGPPANGLVLMMQHWGEPRGQPLQLSAETRDECDRRIPEETQRRHAGGEKK